MLYDTDVLIWVFRGDEAAAGAVDGDDARCMSIVGYMELIQGARNRREARLIRSFLADSRFLLLPLTENIGHRAAIYMEEFAASHGMRVADALIASTAAENHLTLCTGDRAHFRPIRELELVLFRP